MDNREMIQIHDPIPLLERSRLAKLTSENVANIAATAAETR
jgi:hypothetical protein